MQHEKIMRFLTKYKYCIGFCVIFSVIFVGLYFGIMLTDEAFTNKHIREEQNLVVGKIYSRGHESDYYLIETEDNDTFCILDDGSGDAKILYDQIETNKIYNFILQDNGIEEPSQYSYILKVYNVTD